MGAWQGEGDPEPQARMCKSDGVFGLSNDQKFPTTTKSTEPLFVLGGCVGLVCSMEHKGWLCAVCPCHLKSSPLWTSSSIKHGEEEPSYTSVPMGWTRYYEASDQHTVGTKKKKTSCRRGIYYQLS